MAPLAVIETELIYRLTELELDWRAGVLTLTGILYTVGFILWFLAGNNMPSRFAKPLLALGRASFGIFLLHSTVLEATARLTQKFVPQLLAYPICLLLFFVLVSTGLPLLVMVGVERSPLRRYYRYVFG